VAPSLTNMPLNGTDADVPTTINNNNGVMRIPRKLPTVLLNNDAASLPPIYCAIQLRCYTIRSPKYDDQ
jgi:hypothetical protein